MYPPFCLFVPFLHLLFVAHGSASGLLILFFCTRFVFNYKHNQYSREKQGGGKHLVSPVFTTSGRIWRALSRATLTLLSSTNASLVIAEGPD
uniref:Putative secreted peptide n=1 Tax=Anopheles braziliensis TaxID=58242 RepID=A0A2M3ZV10_9DIPT